MKSAPVIFAVFAFCLFGQDQTINLGGADLRLGMAEDSALARLAVLPDSRLQQMADGAFQLLNHKSEHWIVLGDVLFRNGVLTRVCLHMGVGTENRTGRSLVEALYNAIAATGGASPTNIWAATNSSAEPSFREVHLIYADREVVVSAAMPDGKELSFVQVYFPRVLAKP